MTTDPIRLPDHGNEGALWSALLDLAEAQPTGWTLVGALMVALHGYESGLPIIRATQDLDAIVEVRGLAHATRAFAATLTELGWRLDDADVTADEIGFRFTKERLKLDLLAPEGLGARADLTTIPPLQSVEIPGGTQALQRTRPITVAVGGRSGTIPRPDMLGALVIKSCAAVGDVGNRDKSPDRHRQDLAHLYARVAEPRVLTEATTTKDRRRLRRAEPLWDVLSDPELDAQARAARALILRAPTG